ncbi:HFX_2341 family transcriptional regulator domain-containing protein [Geoglobus ahangari]|nr:DUF6293 family protein [Geoglobus ahangari]
MRTIEVVHIIPLGFERSVVTEPIKVLGGVRAHVITIGKEHAEKYDLYEIQSFFEAAVTHDLKKMGLEVVISYADLFDFREALREISKAVRKEKERGSKVYINLSSHGRLVSIASALVGWYHGVRMYYVMADRYAENEEEIKKYGRSVCQKARVLEVPRVEMVRLSEEERFAISQLYLSERKYMKLEELAKEFCKRFPQDYRCEYKKEEVMTRESRQRVLTKLHRRVVSKLASRGLITHEKIGRNVILRLTEDGETLALLDGC